MATRTVIRNGVRLALGDWPRNQSTLASGIDATQLTLAVASGAGINFSQGDIVEVDAEVMLVMGVATDTLTVLRGYQATAGATHNSGAKITIADNFTDNELNQWINKCFEESYPEKFVLAENATLAIVASDREYTLPTGVTSESLVQFQKETYGGSGFFLDEPRYYSQAGKIFLEYSPAEALATRIYYMTPYPALATEAATSDFPQQVIDAYCAYRDYDDQLRKRAKYDEYTARADQSEATLYELLNLKRERYNDYRKKLLQVAMPMPSFKLKMPKR